MADELLPCPFCGGEPHARTSSDFTKSSHSVFCRNCFASTPLELDERLARAAWNRRPSAIVEEPLPQRWHDVDYLMSIIDSAIEDGFDPDEDGPLLDEIRAELKAIPPSLQPHTGRAEIVSLVEEVIAAKVKELDDQFAGADNRLQSTIGFTIDRLSELRDSLRAALNAALTVEPEAGEVTVKPEHDEVMANILWIESYVDMTTDKNWRDMRLLCERQVARLKDALAIERKVAP